jgi:hypothetical protein
MKKFIALFAAVTVLHGGAAVFAADNDDHKDGKKDEDMCCKFLDMAEKMLSQEQLAKAKDLHAACAKAGCTAESQKAFFAAVKDIMTKEQIAACKQHCTKELILGCPICGGAPMCCYFMAKFELFTAEQKAKAEKLHQECEKAGCSEEDCNKFWAECRALLTAEQIAQCKTNCEKAGIKGCPICSGSEQQKDK